MKKKVIGVVPLWDDEKESLWMLPNYLDAIISESALPIVFPLTTDEKDIKQLASMCDGILFTGGHDVSPSVYGEQKRDVCGEPCAARDTMEGILLDIFIRTQKPALGICRGIQFFNAYLGGTLYQDLPTDFPSTVEHHMSAPYDKYIHTVSLIKETPLYDLLRVDTLPVNSYHHQAIANLSPKLKPMAIAEDGIVEAVYLPEHPFLWAVQWHPEFLYGCDEPSRKIFREFLDAI
ncbi:MAG: gamma-glutamyl-gamma-aminobutyrate hydrolase family protein [Bacteroidales bacterium]|jgi:putative glutamine amidotransferase|nr:gamma-glutamyl-gamma-aminobutyrate hydrolase family protein [Bacteroidales bacterium]